MSTLTRVKDLAAELKLSNKELLQLIRDSHVHVKSHMSGLSDEEVEIIRTKFREKSRGIRTEEMVQTKVRPGVIVRRKVKSEGPVEPEPEPVETLTPKAEEAPIEQPTAESEIETHEPIEPEAEVLVKAPMELEPTVAEVPEEPATGAPVVETEPVQPVVEEEIGPKKKKNKKKPIPQFQVRIISKPELVVPPVAPPKEAVPARPAPRPGVKPELRPESKPEVKPDAESENARSKKKKKGKDKRVVEFSGHYSEGEANKKTDIQFRMQKTTTVQDRTGGKFRPDRRKFKDKRSGEPEQKVQTQPIKAGKRKIKIDEAIRLSELAHQMGVKAQEIIKILLGMGLMATINQALDFETAAVVASEFEYEVEKIGFSENDFLMPQEADKPESKVKRPPVVTIMGHVDHGKTSLLDAIRQSDVIAGEAGGITQHIGAYDVTTPRGEVVFLDTPGHEAFTAMRARGAQVTDIVVLVVAADDGVMGQTREAINHAKAANVPIVVAVNKIDKEGVDLDRVKRELSDVGLVPEDWGGDTIFAHVSAKKKIGIDALLELILLQAEVLDLKANPEKLARGHIVEAKLDKGRGPVATVLVQDGTLKLGDAFVCGLFHGKIRAMFNDQGVSVQQAGPSRPVEIQGIEGVPEAGDAFVVLPDEKLSRRIAEERQMKQREKDLAKEGKVTLESMMAAKAEGEIKALNLILKADVQGSLEAITEALNKLSTDKVKIHVMHGGTGAISESDIMLATASSGIIIGFNVRPAARIREIAERESVEIRFYDIIYNLVNEIKDAMAGMLDPVLKETYLGQAEVLDTFNVPKVGTVAGCTVADGKLLRNAQVRLLRDGVVIYTGKLSSLKRFKDDVKEVTKGYECGVGLERFNDVKVKDIIEAFEITHEKAVL